MFRRTHRFSPLVAALAVVAFAVPATSAAQDYRNPDSKAAAIEAQRDGQTKTDLPSRRDQQAYVDLRSPDARDAGRVAPSTPPPPEIATSPGFDWGDAGIGAGSVLGLLLITLSIMFAVVHRRNRNMEGSGGPALTA
jgi:hypothetical protein